MLQVYAETHSTQPHGLDFGITNPAAADEFGQHVPQSVECDHYGAWQRTLAVSVQFSGIAVHSGQPARLQVTPAKAGNGIVFVTATGARVPASIHQLHPLSGLLSTIIGQDDVMVSTIEHLMAAFAFCGVDNADVVLFGAELPILDGSAAPFVEQFIAAGFAQQQERRNFLSIVDSFTYRAEDGGWIRFDPIIDQETPSLQVNVDYQGIVDQIGKQSLQCAMTPATLRQELAKSRTFGLERLRAEYVKQGKGLGASCDNAVLYTEDALLNPEGLRYTDEAVRHKALDLIGDLFLAGWPLLGHVSAFKPGHKLNADALISLLNSQQYRIVSR